MILPLATTPFGIKIGLVVRSDNAGVENGNGFYLTRHAVSFNGVPRLSAAWRTNDKTRPARLERLSFRARPTATPADAITATMESMGTSRIDRAMTISSTYSTIFGNGTNETGHDAVHVGTVECPLQDPHDLFYQKKGRSAKSSMAKIRDGILSSIG